MQAREEKTQPPAQCYGRALRCYFLLDSCSFASGKGGTALLGGYENVVHILKLFRIIFWISDNFCGNELVSIPKGWNDYRMKIQR